jgi:hypothetical protein
MDTLKLEGAVPLDADVLNQFPPSEVLMLDDQANRPDPPFRTCRFWDGGLLELPVFREKLNWPGMLSK